MKGSSDSSVEPRQEQADKKQAEDCWQGMCSLCGHSGIFRRSHKSIREGYPCPKCKASLRYRHQASIILDVFDNPSIKTFAELAGNPGFRYLSIYEPGIIGPFRKYIKHLKGYHQSYYWADVRPGEYFKGVRCENLESLTFEDDFFDLIITSDIFEHIRKPFTAFGEIYRVLKPGGHHIFTVPMLTWPLPEETQSRVKIDGVQDIHLKEPVYHGSPVDKNGSLVYTDFGMDILPQLESIGFETSWRGVLYNLTFDSRKPHGSSTDPVRD
jgi:SAM-dependent methyltransferase